MQARTLALECPAIAPRIDINDETKNAQRPGSTAVR